MTMQHMRPLRITAYSSGVITAAAVSAPSFPSALVSMTPLTSPLSPAPGSPPSSHPPSNTSSSADNDVILVYSRLEAAFRTHIPDPLPGVNAVEYLEQLASRKRKASVLVIGGDQCTGKSTLTARLARTLCGEDSDDKGHATSDYRSRIFSAGQLFRQEAARRGISSAELSRRALSDPSIDVGLEYRMCCILLSGEVHSGMDSTSPMNHDGQMTSSSSPASSPPLVLEGRQPGVMAHYCANRFNRGPSFSLRLTCSIREQALRFIERQGGREMMTLAEKELPLKLSSLRAASDRLESGLAKRYPQLIPLCQLFRDNDARDDDDRRRYVELYGQHPLLDYRNPALYHALIDTTLNQPNDTFNQAMEALNKTEEGEKLIEETERRRLALSHSNKP